MLKNTGNISRFRRDEVPALIAQALNIYGGYNESRRAPTAIEFGCANSDQPCKLPNAMAGDLPLNQVVTCTLEAGRAMECWPVLRTEL